MIICHCAGVTDCTIRMLIEAGATSLGEITRRCGAGVPGGLRTCGGGCGSFGCGSQDNA